MEEVQWDRQSFVTKTPPPRNEGSSILGPLLFVIVVGLAGAGGYLYIKNNGIPQVGIKPQMSELTTRLEEMNARLEALEKRLRVSPPSRSSATDPPSSSAAAVSGAQIAPSSSRLARAASGPTPFSAGPQSSASPQAANTLRMNPSSRDMAAVEGELASNREAWEATADRLGDTVGELGNQRRELTNTRESLGELQRNLERTYLPFDLRKNGGRQRVGPIWMDLRRGDRQGQRYTMGGFFGGKGGGVEG